MLREGRPRLQRALRGADGSILSIQAFMEHDDAERLFCSEGGMSVQLYLELCDMVSDFTSEVLARAAGF